MSNDKTILHVVNHSVDDNDLVVALIRHANHRDGIIFIENGTYNCVVSIRNQQLVDSLNAEIWTLLPDMLARGFTEDKILSGINQTDYDGFVDLALRYDLVQSW